MLHGPQAADADLALMVPSTANVVDAVDRGLIKFQRAGQEVVAVQVGGPIPRGSIERRLCQAGVRAVIAAPTSARLPSARPLPFGVWAFGPQISAPTAGRLLPVLRRKTADFRSAESPAVASIDMKKLAGANAREWNSVERLIDQAAEISALGTTRIMTIAEVAAELSQAAVTSPQRSILRAAA
jgi:hypothetical protein